MAVRGIRAPTPGLYNYMDKPAAIRHIKRLLGASGFVERQKGDWEESSVVWAAASRRFPRLPGKGQKHSQLQLQRHSSPACMLAGPGVRVMKCVVAGMASS